MKEQCDEMFNQMKLQTKHLFLEKASHEILMTYFKTIRSEQTDETDVDEY